MDAEGCLLPQAEADQQSIWQAWPGKTWFTWGIFNKDTLIDNIYNIW